MTDVPGTPDAAYPAFVMVEELIYTLTANGHLEKSEERALFENILKGISSDTRSTAKDAPKLVRKMMAELKA